jgi:hypothetical protein
MWTLIARTPPPPALLVRRVLEVQDREQMVPVLRRIRRVQSPN